MITCSICLQSGSVGGSVASECGNVGRKLQLVRSVAFSVGRPGLGESAGKLNIKYSCTDVLQYSSAVSHKTCSRSVLQTVRINNPGRVLTTYW